MKVVLGFDNSWKNRTKMNTPIASLDNTLRILIVSPSTLSGPNTWCPISYDNNSPNNAPMICPEMYPVSNLLLYLLYFLRQFERVITGFRLAPVNPPDMHIAMKRHPTDWASISNEDKKQAKP